MNWRLLITRLYLRLLAGGAPEKGQEIAALRRSMARTRWLRRTPPHRILITPAGFGEPAGKWIIPKRAERPGRPLIVYFPGGQYVAPASPAHQSLAWRLAEICDAKLFMPDYRLAPEHPYPAALQDSENVWRWLLQSDYQPNQIVLIGDSSGGALALSLAIALHAQTTPLPCALVMISPFVDLTAQFGVEKIPTDPLLSPELLHSCAHGWAGAEKRDAPGLSPLYADLSGLPPVMVQIGGGEFLEQMGAGLSEKLTLAGVDSMLDHWPDMPHLWHCFPAFLPEARGAIRAIADFIIARTRQ